MTTPPETLEAWRAENLRRMITPASIAVVGASNRAGHFANQPLVNLRRHGYSGGVYPVNPNNDEVGGYRCYPRLADLPTVPDLVIVVVRPDQAVDTVREAAELGAGGAVVVGSGFAETGSAEGVARQDELLDIVTRTALRVCGPNTLGIANFHSGAVAYASGNIPPTPRIGGIAVVSQSGGCSFTVLNRAWRTGIGVGHVAVAGNELDISIPEFVEHYLRRPEVSSVACYLEAVRDPAGLERVGAVAAELEKSVFVLKSASSDLGRLAAAAHTGALATSDAVCDAAFRQWGLIRARTFDELIAAAAISARYGPVEAQRFGVYAQGGGIAVVASDLFDAAGLRLATLSDDTRAGLKRRMPDTTPGNPFDSGGQFLSEGAEVLTDALNDFSADPDVSSVVYMLMPVAGARLAVYTQGIVAAARDSAKPSVVLHYGAGAITQEATDRIIDAGILLVDPPEAGVAALRLWSGSAGRRPSTAAVARRSSPDAPQRAAAIVASWRQAGRRTVSEHDAGALLDIYGIDHVRSVLVSGEAQVAAAVSGHAGPYVVKVASDDVPHRSDVGGVRLGVVDAAGAVTAYRDVLASVRSAHPDAVLQGVTISETAAGGVELIVGVTYDATFGPVILLGIGGVYAEIWQDSVLRLPPLDEAAAQAMIGSLRGAPLLAGVRGGTGVDRDALVDLLIRVAELAVDLGAEVAAFEMNPVVAGPPGGRVVAVDALIELTGAS